MQEEQRNSNRNRDKSIRAITFKSNTMTQDPIQDPLDVPPSGMFAPLPPGDMNDEAITASEKQHQEIVRRMHTDDVSPTNTPIQIMDSAANISCIGRDFEVLFYTGETMTVSGAMAEMQSIEYEIVTGATVVETPLSTQSYIIIINQAAYKPNERQYESLLHCDQARYHNVTINDLSKFFRDG